MVIEVISHVKLSTGFLNKFSTTFVVYCFRCFDGFFVVCVTAVANFACAFCNCWWISFCVCDLNFLGVHLFTELMFWYFLCLSDFLVDWMLAWLIIWLVVLLLVVILVFFDLLVGFCWLVCWFISCLTGCFDTWTVAWPVGYSFGWLFFFCRLLGWLHGWLVGCLVG